jgi:branched-chain amino acid transport system permease protein
MGINVNRIILFNLRYRLSSGRCRGVMRMGIFYNAVWPYMGTMAGMKASAPRFLAVSALSPVPCWEGLPWG